jgi:peptide chain release factor
MMRLILTSGRGPAECRIALKRALDLLAAEAAISGVACDVTVHGGDRHGPASAVALLACDHDPPAARRFGAAWCGSILWIAPSPVRPNHKRKNWFIGVAELPAQAAAQALAQSDVRFETFRAGGPGGQHQNKTESAVRAVYIRTGLSVVARDGRSQHRNRALALSRLGDLLAAAAQLASARDDALIQAAHDRLERGKPVRTFRGAAFKSD